MTSITIDIPERQVAVLTAKAKAQGITLEDWFREVAEKEAPPTSAAFAAMALEWSRCPAVESIPGKVSGAWVLKDTRMPVSIIFDNLAAGMSVEEVMDEFDVTREQITEVMEFVTRSLDKPPSYEP